MSRPRMRPRFEIELCPEQADVLDRIGRAASDPVATAGTSVRGRVHADQAELCVPAAEERFFSPVLLLTRVEEDGRLRLRGRFSPHPHVWTLFLCTYGVLGLGGIGALMYGLSQWLISQTPWALLGVPAALALAGFVYGAVFIGQGLSAEQMYVLRAFVDHALDEVKPRVPPDIQG